MSGPVWAGVSLAGGAAAGIGARHMCLSLPRAWQFGAATGVATTFVLGGLLYSNSAPGKRSGLAAFHANMGEMEDTVERLGYDDGAMSPCTWSPPTAGRVGHCFPFSPTPLAECFLRLGECREKITAADAAVRELEEADPHAKRRAALLERVCLCMSAIRALPSFADEHHRMSSIQEMRRQTQAAISNASANERNATANLLGAMSQSAKSQ